MRQTVPFFLIDGKPMLAPDGEVTISFEDLDDADSGRDQSGIMHRIPIRLKVPSWSFAYSHLTEQEKNYMESLFGGATFRFTHPDPLDSSRLLQTECYRAKYGITWRSADSGLWSGYHFHIIAC